MKIAQLTTAVVTALSLLAPTLASAGVEKAEKAEKAQKAEKVEKAEKPEKPQKAEKRG